MLKLLKRRAAAPVISTWIGSKWDDDDYGPPAGYRTDPVTGIVTRVAKHDDCVGGYDLWDEADQ